MREILLEKEDFITFLQKEDLILDEELYESYLKYCFITECGIRLYEGSLFEGRIKELLMKIADFVRDIAKNIGCKVKELFKLFKDKYVFAFFHNLGWNYESFLKIISAATSIFSAIFNPIGTAINLFFPDLVAKGMSKLSDLKGVKNLKERIKKFTDWIKKNKRILIISSIAFAGLYLIIWTFMANTGNIAYDFDISDLLNALTGKLTFIDWISSEDGIKQLILFALGIVGLSSVGVIANIASSSTQLVISLIRLLIEKARIKLKKGKDSDEDIDRIAVESGLLLR
jgi:hypothetical protein